MTDDLPTLRRDLELTRGLVSDQNDLIDTLREERELYREALAAVLKDVPTDKLADHVPVGVDWCLQRRNGKVLPIRYRRRYDRLYKDVVEEVSK